MEDWASGGLTRQAYDYALPAIRGGLSSRWVLGETGPMHLVTDALSLDRSLLPLWRKIAAAADASAGSSVRSDVRGPSAAAPQQQPNPWRNAAPASPSAPRGGGNPWRR